MNDQDKTKEKLLKELQELRKDYNSLKALYQKDIAEHKQEKEGLIIANRNLAIFENVQEVFYQTDLDGIILEISPSVRSNSEFSRDEIIGTSVYNLYYNPNDRETLLKEIIKNGELRDYELKLKTKTEKIKDVSINARLIFGDDGRPTHIDGVLRNIADRKQAVKGTCIPASSIKMPIGS
jgi:PAS domain S-box-containing protein